MFNTNGQGYGQGEIYDSSDHLVDAANPATAGSTVVRIHCTGLGPVSNHPPTGSATPSGAMLRAVSTPIVTIGNAYASGVTAFLLPGTVGVYEIDALVPATSRKGPAVPVYVVGGANVVTMAVQ
jgi:uncharacterized protein (TIGR03437 family)